MKLRLRGDAIRLRLSRADVQELRETGRVQEQTHLGPACLTYALQRAAERQQISAELDGTTVLVQVPAKIVDDWAESEQVGFDAEQRVGARTLKILVEKDFQCLVPRGDGQDGGSFPNPAARDVSR